VAIAILWRYKTVVPPEWYRNCTSIL